ncbi:MAG: hypothetical protein KF866_02670 [Phycisphaeraceae bacterium]|nr:hypothetical protein [Phycisphaeraceae bacterium]MCW5753400.1 hypothetical protein [Phycisphaeraceae bacterium]
MDKKSYDRWLAERALRREPAEQKARKLIIEQRFDDAAEAVRTVDDSIYGIVAIGRLFRERLETIMAEGLNNRNRGEAEAVFRHAILWMHSAYPDPHTDYEAEDYARGRAEDTARLVHILGYHPGPRK